METISDRLKQIRDCLKLTQEALSDQTGIKRSTYAGYEKGISLPQADLLEKLSTLFNIDCNWLLTGKGNMFIVISSRQIEADEKTARISELEEKIKAFEKQEARIAALEAENKELEAKNKRLSDDLVGMVRKFVIAPLTNA
jgi:transcriptional regulator with XRE-family HTH domain